MDILVKKKDRILYITLKRPAKLNAFDSAMSRDLKEVWHSFDTDPDAWVAILTGAGDKAFCAGADLVDFLNVFEEASRQAQGRWPVMYSDKRPLDRIYTWKPIIAAINGFCLGHGLTLALKCDIRIASENASFAMPQVKRGVFPSEASQTLPRCVPMSLAMEMLLTGEPIDAQEAFRAGLISRVVKPTELIPTATKIAKSICENAPLSVRGAKEAIIRGADLPLEEGLRVAWTLERLNDKTEDFYEGMKAFMEKRAPRFTGK